jgi:hypothetical protein
MMAHPNSSSHRLTGSGSCSMLFIAEMHCIDKQFERDVHDSSSVYKPTGMCKEAHWCATSASQVAGHTDRTQKATAAGKGSESVRAKGRGRHRISSKSARDLAPASAKLSCPALPEQASERASSLHRFEFEKLGAASLHRLAQCGRRPAAAVVRAHPTRWWCVWSVVWWNERAQPDPVRLLHRTHALARLLLLLRPNRVRSTPPRARIASIPTNERGTQQHEANRTTGRAARARAPRPDPTRTRTAPPEKGKRREPASQADGVRCESGSGVCVLVGLQQFSSPIPFSPFPSPS